MKDADYINLEIFILRSLFLIENNWLNDLLLFPNNLISQGISRVFSLISLTSFYLISLDNQIPINVKAFFFEVAAIENMTALLSLPLHCFLSSCQGSIEMYLFFLSVMTPRCCYIVYLGIGVYVYLTQTCTFQESELTTSLIRILHQPTNQSKIFL